MRLIAIAAAGILFATASTVSASPLNSSPELKSFNLAQTQQQTAPAPAQQQKQKAAPQQGQNDQKGPATNTQKTMPAKNDQKAQKSETMTQKVKRTWRRWTSPSHTFCVRSPIPIPLTSKTCTARGKTVEEARAVCVQQNPLSYVNQGKC